MIYLSKEEFDAAIDKVMAKLDKLDDKIKLVKSNTAATVEIIDKFLKKVR